MMHKTEYDQTSPLKENKYDHNVIKGSTASADNKSSEPALL